MVDSNVEFGIQYLPKTVWAQDDFYPPGCAADQRISANTTVFEAIRQLDGNICGSRHRVVALIALLAPEPEPRPGGGPGDGNGDGGPGAGEAAAEDPADNDADLELDADPADPIDSDHDRDRDRDGSSATEPMVGFDWWWCNAMHQMASVVTGESVSQAVSEARPACRPE